MGRRIASTTSTASRTARAIRLSVTATTPRPIERLEPPVAAASRSFVPQATARPSDTARRTSVSSAALAASVATTTTCASPAREADTTESAPSAMRLERRAAPRRPSMRRSKTAPMQAASDAAVRRSPSRVNAALKERWSPRCAAARTQAGRGCRCAPRPNEPVPASTAISRVSSEVYGPSPMRTKSSGAPRSPQPTHIRSGPTLVMSSSCGSRSWVASAASAFVSVVVFSRPTSPIDTTLRVPVPPPRCGWGDWRARKACKDFAFLSATALFCAAFA